jgi:replication factor C subunit 2/4
MNKANKANDYTLFVNKYKPLLFSDFENNNDIVLFLKTFIEINNLNILFISDTGTGKSSFINALINEYYKDVPQGLQNDNILYINSLREQGINYYRNDVKTFCQTCSLIKHKKKIVVLDDIDLINEQSQQVFRNCIDKYNNNVHFISSSSNIQKVIESLQSRLTIVKINPLRRENLIKIIDNVIRLENICITEDAKKFILDICNNNVKILLTYLEKFKLLNEAINVDVAMNICSNISFSIFTDYTECIKTQKLNEAIQILYSIYDKGYSAMDIYDGYFLFVKITDALTENQKYDIIPYICKYINVFHNIHEDEIELALFTNNLMALV